MKTNQPVSAAAVEPAERHPDGREVWAYIGWPKNRERFYLDIIYAGTTRISDEYDYRPLYAPPSATPEAVIARPLHTSGVVDHKTQSIINNEVCPNCVSPWKCNGPHIGERPESGYEDAASTAASAGEAHPFAFYDGEEKRFMLAADDSVRGCLSMYPEVVELYTREQIEAAERARPAAPVIAPGESCGSVLVGSGTDAYDPLCELPKGHRGMCRSSAATDQYKLNADAYVFEYPGNPSDAFLVWPKDAEDFRADGYVEKPLYLSPPAATGSEGAC